MADRRKLLEEAIPSFLEAMDEHRELKFKEEVETEKELRKEEARQERSGLPEEAFTGGGMSDLAILPGSIGNMLGQLLWDAAVANRPELAFLSMAPMLARGNKPLGKALSHQDFLEAASSKRIKGDPGYGHLDFAKDADFFQDGKTLGYYSPRGYRQDVAKGPIPDYAKLRSTFGFQLPSLTKRMSLQRSLGKPMKDLYKEIIGHEGTHWVQGKRGFEGTEAALHKVEADYIRGKKTPDPQELFREVYGKDERGWKEMPTSFTIEVPEKFAEATWKDALKAKNTKKQQQKYLDYLRSPHEVEARLEQIVYDNSKWARNQLKSAGYTEKQITDLSAKYKAIKEDLIPEHFKGTEFEDIFLKRFAREMKQKNKSIPKKAKGGYIPDSKVFSYITNV